ncbi:MAG: hypothetical protein Q9170_001821 [Blastenia crenularia]
MSSKIHFSSSSFLASIFRPSHLSLTQPSRTFNAMVSLTICDLPTEIRIEIISYLLPDIPVIECDIGWSPNKNNPPHYWSPGQWSTCEPNGSLYDFRSDREPCSTTILRANKQLYEDGIWYLYANKTYKLSVFNYGFDFLTKYSFLDRLPEFPFHKVKEFVIQICGCGLYTTGYRLRANLVWLCGLLRDRKTHFQKLRIEFVGDDYWEHAWDIEEHTPPDFSDRFNFGLPNADFIAWENCFPSTFAWIISPLAQLQSVADECVFDLPPPLRGKQHLRELAQWYVDGMNGKYAFEEDWLIERDKTAFQLERKHPEGEARKYGCDDCDELYKFTRWYI